MQRIEQSIDRYLAAIDSVDRATPEVAEAEAEQLKEKIETLKQRMQKLKEIETQLRESPDQRTPKAVACHRVLKMTSSAPKLFKFSGSSAVAKSFHTATRCC